MLFKTRGSTAVQFIADGIDRWQTNTGYPRAARQPDRHAGRLEEADDVARFFEGAPDMSDDPDVRAALRGLQGHGRPSSGDFADPPESEGGMGITVDFTDQVDPHATA